MSMARFLVVFKLILVSLFGWEGRHTSERFRRLLSVVHETPLDNDLSQIIGMQGSTLGRLHGSLPVRRRPKVSIAVREAYSLPPRLVLRCVRRYAALVLGWFAASSKILLRVSVPADTCRGWTRQLPVRPSCITGQYLRASKDLSFPGRWQRDSVHEESLKEKEELLPHRPLLDRYRNAGVTFQPSARPAPLVSGTMFGTFATSSVLLHFRRGLVLYSCLHFSRRV